jgi:hypothetical protein
MRTTIIAMDGQGCVNFDAVGGQEFISEEVAQAEADRLNTQAELNGSDWFYMPSPASRSN